MEQFSFPFKKTRVSELPLQIQQLIDAAQTAAAQAYAPYSGFKVGAAALLANGEMRAGANHENASYPAGLCAERSLLGAINPLIPAFQITAIAVVNLSEASSNDILSPCGICRQTLLEQQLAQQHLIAVYMCSTAGDVVCVADASFLLPFYFSKDNLDVKEA
jgi:cytidine deaminase